MELASQTFWQDIIEQPDVAEPVTVQTATLPDKVGSSAAQPAALTNIASEGQEFELAPLEVSLECVPVRCLQSDFGSSYRQSSKKP